MVELSKRQWIGIILQSAILLFIIAIGVQTLGLSKGGFEDTKVLFKFLFYIGPAVGALFIILLLTYLENLIDDGDKRYGNGLAFYSPIEIPALNIKFFESSLKVLLTSIIVFGLMGFFILFSQTSFTGTAILAQQFTKIDQLIFNVSLVPISENLTHAALIAFIIVIFRFVARKYNWSTQNFISITLLIVFLLGGLYGVANHQLRYPNSDIALTVVFFFWSIGGVISVLTGMFIPFMIMHTSNNFFIDARELFSNDFLIISIFSIIILAGFLLFMLIKNVKFRNK